MKIHYEITLKAIGISLYIICIVSICFLIEIAEKCNLVSFLNGIPLSALEWPLLGGFCSILYRFIHIRMPGNEISIKKNYFLIWMIVKPVISIIIGTLTYMLLITFNMLITSETEITNKYFVNVIVFISGFSDTFAINYFYLIIKNFKESKKTRP